MIDEPAIDGRRYEQLKSELMRRAEVLLSDDGRALPVGKVTAALFDAVARIGEEVTRRLDKTPEKQVANFLTETRIGRDPARPAELPVAFVLAERAADGKALTGTRLMTSGDEPVIFETLGDVTLIGGGIIAIRGVNAGADAITLPPDAFTSLDPKPPEVARFLKSSASAGATKLQLNPVAGLEAGMILKLGPAADAPQHRITALEGDLVTIDPPLGQSVSVNLAVTTLSGFAPFAAGTRSRQSHVLYLGHETLFDVPSAVSLRITGLALPEATIWEWWGTTEDDEKPDWRRFKQENVGGVLELTKLKGKTVMLEVHGQTKFWLRASLTGKPDEVFRATDIRIAVAVNGLCSDKYDSICKGTTNDEALKVDFEAIANTTPVVPNKGFHPFGREPRLFDTFYVGCVEALSKPDAKVTMCFDLGGPEFGPLVAVVYKSKALIFGVGTDGLVYSLRLEEGVTPSLEPLPPPPDTFGSISGQVGLAAQNGPDGAVRLVAAGTGGVHLATFKFSEPITVDKVKWERLASPDVTDIFEQVAILAGPDGAFDVLGRAKDKLVIWESETSHKAETYLGKAVDLLTINDGTSVAIIETSDDKARIRVRTSIDEGVQATFDLEALPGTRRTAWLPNKSEVFIAGRKKADQASLIGLLRLPLSADAGKTLLRPRGAKQPVERIKFSKVNDVPKMNEELKDSEGTLPIAFEEPDPNSDASDIPALTVATPMPQRFLFRKAHQPGFFKAIERESIGFSGNKFRQVIAIGGRSVMQREDFGILHRPQLWRVEQIEGERKFVATQSISKSAQYAVFAQGGKNNSFSLIHSNVSLTLLRRFAGKPNFRRKPAGDARLFAYKSGDDGSVNQEDGKLVLKNDGQSGNESEGVVAIDGEGIWILTPASGSGWQKPDDFPAVPDHGLPCRFLHVEPASKHVEPASKKVDLQIADAIRLVKPEDLIELLKAGPHSSIYDPGFQIKEPVQFVEDRVTLFPHNLLDGKIARLRRDPKTWTPVGPNQPANPTLSWEYWNGRAWWALDNLVDGTANLLLSDSVRFTVPPDLAATEVGGKKNHWLRARLIGGEYGQARVTVTTTEIGTDKKTTEQTIDRDLTAIRAPYVARFRIGYCAPNFVLPEVILTEDSLGIRNQTSANVEGQRIEIFAPIADLMNPHPISTADNAEDDAKCCDPCAAGEASAPVAQAAPGSGESFKRGLLIGLAKLPKPDRLTLYADVVPNGQVRELKAEVLHKGAFKPLQPDDNTYGLSEPGIISFQVPFAVDQVDVMGQSAYWLRLRPKSGGADWSPNLRGLYLNAALARSVETRDISGLGASSGIPNQELTLAQPPIEEKSLDLRVRERPSDAEREALQRDGGADVILETIGEMPGPWVRWLEVDDLGAWESTDRAYMLDPETGTVRFGDGVHGMIPPLGADIVANRYRRVIGAKANGTQAGAELQLISPIAGVEKVVALDRAAGGADVETNEVARKRQPAKIRHGNRVHTLADIEDFALASARDVAQARASGWRGGVRLIVVLTGANPVPYPARIRALTRQLTEAAGYGLSRPGGLKVIGPRLLKLAVNINMIPDDPDQSVSLAQKVRDDLQAFLDPASGGFDGAGWPLGRVPTREDIAGALAAVADKALIERVDLRKEDGGSMHDAVAPNVLVQLGDVTFDPQEVGEVAA